MTVSKDHDATAIPPLAVDLNEAGRILGVSHHTVRRRAKAGELTWYTDGKMMITYESLQAFVSRKVAETESGSADPALPDAA